MILHDRDGEPVCEIADPVKDLVLQTAEFRLYLASMVGLPPDTNASPSDERDTRQRDFSHGVLGDKVVLRISRHIYDESAIYNEAMVLQKMMGESDTIEGLLKSRSREPVHYDWLFPRLERTFVTSEDQGSRLANLISFPDVEATKLFPLPKLQEFCSIDCKTAAWILGRCFKLQTFWDIIKLQAEFQALNVLISPSAHRMIYLGYSKAQIGAAKPDAASNSYSKKISSAERNIRIAANEMLGWIESDQQKAEIDFCHLLKEFANGKCKTGEKAHEMLYEWIGENWGRKYHPFTYYVHSESAWRRVDEPAS